MACGTCSQNPNFKKWTKNPAAVLAEIVSVQVLFAFVLGKKIKMRMRIEIVIIEPRHVISNNLAF